MQEVEKKALEVIDAFAPYRVCAWSDTLSVVGDGRGRDAGSISDSVPYSASAS